MGMSLRDWLAGRTMAAMLAGTHIGAVMLMGISLVGLMWRNDRWWWPLVLMVVATILRRVGGGRKGYAEDSRLAYLAADAMLCERGKETT